jgi:NAD(P)-dependent dehydrogenase (short-subunit alcohol dehydrogenase family)
MKWSWDWAGRRWWSPAVRPGSARQRGRPGPAGGADGAGRDGGLSPFRYQLRRVGEAACRLRGYRLRGLRHPVRQRGHPARRPAARNIRGRGVSINTSSVSGLFGDYRSSAYNASKGAVTNMPRSLALDYAEHGIRVNAVCPGSMRTPMSDACAQAIGPEVCERMFSERYPGHRIAAAEEVAKVVVFLHQRGQSACRRGPDSAHEPAALQSLKAYLVPDVIIY